MPKKLLLCAIAFFAATDVLVGHALAQEGKPPDRGVGYPTVAAALEALRARSDVRISSQGGWTIVDVPAEKSLWSFTPPTHPAHPAVVKRSIVERNQAVGVDMGMLCQAEKLACDKLLAEFQQLTEQMKTNSPRPSPPAQSAWAPSDQQKLRAEQVLSRFLRATDAGNFAEAYALLTPGMKAQMRLDQFEILGRQQQAQTGGPLTRSNTRATWYNNPPQAAGVFAAFDIRCSSNNAPVCEEVVILQEQADSTFLVMRKEINFIDKENEKKLRTLQ
jgi:hypothetical protein